MCNVCNSGAYGRSSCGCAFNRLNALTSTSSGCAYNTTANSGNGYGCSNGCSCGCWNGTWQRLCRDACGNILARNGFNFCCCQQHHCHNHCCNCGCCCGNGNTSGNNGGTTTQNGNGSFQCITFCGYGNAATQNTAGRTATNTAAYYARQYGLTCDDNADCVYNY